MANFNKLRWKLMRMIVELIQKQGGIVFSGYNRDAIIHDYNARKYYEEYDPFDNTDEKYQDPAYLPESFERNISPRDIDIYMQTDKIEFLLESLKDNDLIYTNRGDSDLQLYMEIQNMMLKKIQVCFNTNNVLLDFFKSKNVKVNIDIVHSEKITFMPAIEAFDMECNIIRLSPDDNLYLPNTYTLNIKSYDKLRMLNRIIEDIVNKRTKLIKANVSDERINKMLDKNWTITGVYGALFIEKNSKESCYICLEEFASHVQFKYRCCNGRTHRRCMKKLIEKNNIEVQKTFDCSFCRTENNMTSLDHKLINSSA